MEAALASPRLPFSDGTSPRALSVRALVLNFAPIAALVVATGWPRAFARGADAWPGRLAAVLCVILYATEDVLLGTAASLAVVAFYQRRAAEEAFSAYRADPPPAKSAAAAAAAAQFREAHCEGGVLTYKAFAVRPELAEFVYPELAFDGAACGACDPNCGISISRGGSAGP